MEWAAVNNPAKQGATIIICLKSTPNVEHCMVYLCLHRYNHRQKVLHNCWGVHVEDMMGKDTFRKSLLYFEALFLHNDLFEGEIVLRKKRDRGEPTNPGIIRTGLISWNNTLCV